MESKIIGRDFLDWQSHLGTRALSAMVAENIKAKIQGAVACDIDDEKSVNHFKALKAEIAILQLVQRFVDQEVKDAEQVISVQL